MTYPFDAAVTMNGASGFWWFALSVYVLLLVLLAPKFWLHSDMMWRE